MIGADPLREVVGPDAEVSYHHRVLYRLVLAAAGRPTGELQLMYEALAPVIYSGTVKTPVERRWRRELLDELRDAGAIAVHETPHGRVWIPAADVVDECQACRPAPNRIE